MPSVDVQKYLLATSDFSNSMQDDTNHYITRDRINNASFRQKLYPISEKYIEKTKPSSACFSKYFYLWCGNPIVGSLLWELDVGKKDLASNLIKKAPQPPGIDFILQNRLNKLQNDGNNNSNIIRLSLPPSPPPFNFQQPQPASFNNFIPPPPPPPLYPEIILQYLHHTHLRRKQNHCYLACKLWWGQRHQRRK